MQYKNKKEHSLKIMWATAILLILTSGIAYRAVKGKVGRMIDDPISPPVPLKTFPLMLNHWIGEEIPIAAVTQNYMKQNFADDYISRRYTKENQWVDLYVVYCSLNPAGIVGHCPSVCYPANGWIAKQSEKITITTASGRAVPCVFYYFIKISPYQELYALSFYVVNGSLLDEESKFTGFWNRRLNMSRDPTRYVAQVQISSTQKSFITQAAGDFGDSIVKHFPVVMHEKSNDQR